MRSDPVDEHRLTWAAGTRSLWLGDIPGQYGPHPSLQAHPLVVSIL